MLNVRLRSFEYKKDLEKIYLFMMKEENQILFSHGFQVHNLQMFERWITDKFSTNKYHDFFIIEDPFNESTIGFVFSYEFIPHQAHCKYTLCIYEEYQNLGYGVIAAVKIMDYLFSKYPLKRIFISVFSYNKKSLYNNLKGGFEEVGVLPDYRYWNGSYHALHLLTMSRQAFYERYGKLINKIKND